MHTPGQSDLNNRFVTTINTAVDWVMHGIGSFTSAHARYFTEYDTVAMPTSISLSDDVSITEMDVAFTTFLISYFHQLWHDRAAPKVRRITTLIILL